MRVNNVETQRWQDVRVEVLNAVVNKTKLNLLIKDYDSNNISNININYDTDILQKDGDVIINLGFHPKVPEIPSVIGTIENNSPASLAGLQTGDQVLSVNDKNIDNWDSLVEKIQDKSR